jgi:uncharacterized protein YigE (DUF2233 family)
MKIWIEAVLAGLSLVGPAEAQACRDVAFEGASYSVCEAARGSDLRLFLEAADGRPLGTFGAVNAALAGEGRKLAFAMNAGMYHPDRRPVGLFVAAGQTAGKLQTRPGPGNFGLQPNGVFCVAEDRFAVVETLAFDATRPDCRYATQSGPMLVIGGQLHPRFLAESDSTYVRNGVGVSADGGTAYFAISNDAVNFHTFARFFRDGLGAPDALFLDGSISRLYAPDLGRDDFGLPMGPIVGLAVPID